LETDFISEQNCIALNSPVKIIETNNKKQKKILTVKTNEKRRQNVTSLNQSLIT